jgi:hypothetical protein
LRSIVFTKTKDISANTMIGQNISHYRVLEKLGGGAFEYSGERNLCPGSESRCRSGATPSGTGERALNPAMIYILGLASLALKNGQQAVNDFAPGLRYRGLFLEEGSGGSFQAPDYVLCLLGTARAQAMLDKAAATKSYTQLLDIWKNADADFPPAQEAPPGTGSAGEKLREIWELGN